MIISASRRTDIPAFYAEWFMNRIKAGYCAVPNPFNRNQVSYVSLAPEDVDVIVFWTRNPRPLLRHLPELDRRGFRYYFQFTVMNNPRQIDPKSPPVEASLHTFRELAARIGPERVIWRYDPIVFSNLTGGQFHQDTFEYIAAGLHGITRRVVVSVVDDYRKAQKRMRDLTAQDVEITYFDATRTSKRFDQLMTNLARLAGHYEMEIVSCAEEINLGRYNIRPGKCVDDDYIRQTFGLDVTVKKDPSQREACGCVVSKDIGMYDTCLFGCQYCYATQSFDRAKINFSEHNPASPSLVGWYDAQPKPGPAKTKNRGEANQLTLF